MGQIAQVLGQGSQYTYQDKTYTLSPWTFELRGFFEQYLEKEAVSAVRRNQRYLSPEEYKDALAGVMKDIAAGVYTFGTETMSRVLQCDKHVIYLAWLMLKKNHPEVETTLTREMYENDYEGLIGAIRLANADPNEKTPATPMKATAGATTT